MHVMLQFALIWLGFAICGSAGSAHKYGLAPLAFPSCPLMVLSPTAQDQLARLAPADSPILPATPVASETPDTLRHVIRNGDSLAKIASQ